MALAPMVPPGLSSASSSICSASVVFSPVASMPGNPPIKHLGFPAKPPINPPIPNGALNREKSWEHLGESTRKMEVYLERSETKIIRAFPATAMMTWKGNQMAYKIESWRFPEIGVPLVIIHFRLGFSLINHPAIGVPPI